MLSRIRGGFFLLRRVAPRNDVSSDQRHCERSEAKKNRSALERFQLSVSIIYHEGFSSESLFDESLFPEFHELDCSESFIEGSSSVITTISSTTTGIGVGCAAGLGLEAGFAFLAGAFFFGAAFFATFLAGLFTAFFAAFFLGAVLFFIVFFAAFLFGAAFLFAAVLFFAAFLAAFFLAGFDFFLEGILCNFGVK